MCFASVSFCFGYLFQCASVESKNQHWLVAIKFSFLLFLAYKNVILFCWSPTLANISKGHYLHWYETFWTDQKQSHEN